MTRTLSALFLLTFAVNAPAAFEVIAKPNPLTPSSNIEVRFDSAIVGEDQVGQPTDRLPVEITPALDAHFFWDSSRSGRIIFHTAPTLGARYEIVPREGLKDTAGEPVKAEKPAVFNTTNFQVLERLPNYFQLYGQSPDERKPAILLSFNDAIDPKAVARSIYFQDSSGRRIAASVARPKISDFPENHSHPQTWSKQFEAALAAAEPAPPIEAESPKESAKNPATPESPDLTNSLLISPRGPLPVGSNWSLRVDKDVPNADKSATLPALFTVPLGDIRPFAVSNVNPINPYDGDRWFHIYFSKDFPKGTKLADIQDWISIGNAPDDTKLTLEGRTLSVHGSFVRNKPYNITVNSGLEAADGTFLDSGVNENHTFSANEPYLSIPAFEATQISSGQKRFDIAAGNIEQVRVRVKLLEGNDLPYTLRGYENYYNAQQKGGLTYDLVPGRTAYEITFNSEKELDQSEIFTVDWNEVLGGKKTGAAFIHVEGTSKSDRGNDNRKTLAAQALIQISDIGIVSKLTREKALIFAFSHDTGLPLPDVDLSLIDRENNPLGKAKTDANGVAELTLSKDSHWLAATLGEDRHLIEFSAENMPTLPLWSYSIPTEYSLPPEFRRRTSLFTDRPVYRPGETVHLKAIARQLVGDHLEIDAGATAKLEFRDHRYKVIFEKTISFSDRGSLAEDIVIPASSALGNYSVKLDFSSGDEEKDELLEYQSRYANINFLVADFRPNTFEATLAATPPKTGAKEAILDLSANYYMGKPLSEAKVTWHSDTYFTDFSPKGFESFTFGGGGDYEDGEEETEPENAAPAVATYGEVVLGKDGKSQLNVPVPSANGKPGPRSFSVTAEITDTNQQTVAASKSLRIEGSQYYLGVQRPPYLTKSGADLPISLIAVDPKGNPLAAETPAKVTVERIYWNSVRVKSAAGGTTVEHKRIADKVLEQEVKIAPVSIQPGQPIDVKPTLNFSPKQPGSYVITIDSTDPEGNPVQSGTYFYVYGGAPSWAVDDTTAIELVPERTDYKPGETAVILLKTPIFGTALVTVERTGVLRHFITEITEDNPIIEVPLTDADAPNAYISVMLVRGAANSGKKFPEPDYRLGYCQLMVESHAHKLDVALSSSQSEYQPGDEIELTANVKDASGKPVPGAEVTLYAVDEGVLSLMGYLTPNPGDLFHTPLSLAVQTAISLTRLLPENPDELDFANKGFLVGGGGEDNPDRLRKDFRPCAFWAASLITDQNGNVSGKFTAPDSLTRFRTMAVVAAAADQFGSGESAITINKPLMIDPVVPRFANLTDKIWVKAVLHNTSMSSGEFEVALTLNETSSFIPEGPTPPKLTGGPNPLPAADRTMRRTLKLKSGESARVEFPVTFENVGTAQWLWSAKPIKLDKDPPRPLVDRVESKFEVRTPLPLLRESHYITLKGNAKDARNVLADFSPELLEGEGEIVITLSKTRLLEAKDAADYILRYPYGCAEQTTSSLLPWLELRELKRAIPEFSKRSEEEIKNAIQRGADQILSMQTGSGGLAYWPGGTDPQLWASGYAGMGLLLAKKAGADIPDQAIADLKQWLSGQIRNLSTEADFQRLTDSALALYTLALAGDSESSYHDVLFKRREYLNAETRTLLALAILESGGDKERAHTLLTENYPPQKEWSYWLGDNYRRALNVLAWSKLDPAAEELSLAVTSLIGTRDEHGTWGNTWNNAWSMLALGSFAKNEKITLPKVTASYAKGAKNGTLDLEEGLSSAQVTFPFRAADGDDPLRIDIPGDTTLYAHIEMRAYPKIVPQKPRSNGLTVVRDYQKVLPDGTLAPAENLEIGDMVRVELKIEVPGTTDYVAVDDPLPATFEAVNPEFVTQNSRKVKDDTWSPWYSDYRELRADRALFFRDHIYNGGKFTLSYLARVIADGETIAPPTKVEAMYHPDTFALSASQQVNTHK